MSNDLIHIIVTQIWFISKKFNYWSSLMNNFYSSIKIFEIIHKNVKKSTIVNVLNSILWQTLYIFLVIFKNFYDKNTIKIILY